MTTEELHYEFRRRWDKNSNQHKRYLTDVEVDQLLNNVSSDYVDIFATGRNPKNYAVGFEVTGQMIDMVSTLVRSYPEQSALTPLSLDDDVYSVDFSDLDETYRHYITSTAVDEDCGLVSINLEQHHDLNTIIMDYHRQANKRWKRIPATIRSNKLYLYTGGLFNLNGVRITYVKEPNAICLGTYTIAPTVTNPNPTVIKPASSTDIDDSFHHILITMAVQEAARMYGDQFQLVAQSNKLSELT